MRRRLDAGVTLVEVLVVLALVGIMAGALGLSLRGPAPAGDGPRRAAELLAARLDVAAEDALRAGRPAAFVWAADGYRFEAQGPEGWAAHPAADLAGLHGTGAVRLRSPDAAEGRWLLTPAMAPEAALSLLLEDGGGTLALRHDGLSATISEGGT